MDHAEFEKVSAAILALFPPLSELEQRVALTLYRLLAESGPVSTEALARASRIAPAQCAAMLRAWPGVYRDDKGAIIGYGGLTIAETKHRLRLGDATRYSWCAWDTLFIPPLLKRSAQVESICAVTQQRVALTVHPEGIEPGGEVPFISLVAPEPTATADIVSHFCCHVQFFASELVGREWASRHPGRVLATLHQAWQLGRRHNAQRYPMMHT